MPEIWGLLPKAIDDEQLITEAIADAINTHNEDPQAHLETDQALEAHRSADVVDHPAESIPNDKMYTNARAYIAIVDPTSDEDFDTIAGAVTYATSNGGGTILIMPGTHYLGAYIELPANINLEGIDKDSCIISGGSSGTDCLIIPENTTLPGSTQYFRNLTFESDGGYVFQMDDVELYTYDHLIFEDCLFTGDCQYLDFNSDKLTLYRCEFEANTAYAISFEGIITIRECRVKGKDVGSTGHFLEYANDGIFDIDVRYYDSIFVNNTSDGYDWLPNFGLGAYVVRGNKFYNLVATSFSPANCIFTENAISFLSTGYLNFTSDNNIVCNNTFAGGTGNRLRFASGADKNIACNNQVGTSITNSGSNNQIANNVTT